MIRIFFVFLTNKSNNKIKEIALRRKSSGKIKISSETLKLKFIII